MPRQLLRLQLLHPLGHAPVTSLQNLDIVLQDSDVALVVLDGRGQAASRALQIPTLSLECSVVGLEDLAVGLEGGRIGLEGSMGDTKPVQTRMRITAWCVPTAAYIFW